MFTTSKTFKKGLNVTVCLAVIFSNVPVAFAASGNTGITATVADSSTYNDWKKYFPDQATNVSTENSGNNDCAKQLIDAANESIHSLTELNKTNRVGVVIYSGLTNTSNPSPADSTVLLLPLNRYENNVNEGQYLTYTKKSSEIASVEKMLYPPQQKSPTTINQTKTFVGATYTQRGIILGLNKFMNATVSIEDPRAGTLDRMPIMVLMSYGVPTTCSTSFTNPVNSDSKGRNMGNVTNNNATDAMGFVTQLSASYAKSQINSHYKKIACSIL